jgi:hypothetical protein
MEALPRKKKYGSSALAPGFLDIVGYKTDGGGSSLATVWRRCFCGMCCLFREGLVVKKDMCKISDMLDNIDRGDNP